MAIANLRTAEPAAPKLWTGPTRLQFAADVLQRNLDAGHANKSAYIDGRGVTTFGQLADRVARFGACCAPSVSSAKSACCSR